MSTLHQQDESLYRVAGSTLGGLRCPACQQVWYYADSLRRHMAVLHHPCRFCPKAYIRVERHEKLCHTTEYARAAGACDPC